MNTSTQLPPRLEQALAQECSPEARFDAVLAALGEALQCDRCFLHLREPQSRLHRHFCWRRSPEIPDTFMADWQREQPWEQDDPMFAAALRCAAPIYVEDIETAAPEVLNRTFERENLGHRALVHAHLCDGGDLWGVLQPAVFGRPRRWSEGDRQLIEGAIARLTPLAVAYVRAADLR